MVAIACWTVSMIPILLVIVIKGTKNPVFCWPGLLAMSSSLFMYATPIDLQESTVRYLPHTKSMASAAACLNITVKYSAAPGYPWQRVVKILLASSTALAYAQHAPGIWLLCDPWVTKYNMAVNLSAMPLISLLWSGLRCLKHWKCFKRSVWQKQQKMLVHEERHVQQEIQNTLTTTSN